MNFLQFKCKIEQSQDDEENELLQKCFNIKNRINLMIKAVNLIR